MITSRNERRLNRKITDAMRRSKVRPEIVYAFEKTGRLVTKENSKLLTAEELAEWHAAVAEHRA